MRKLFSLIAAVLFAGSMMATEVTFTKADFAGQGTANTGSEVSATKDGVTFTCSKGYCADESLRCYAHGALSITAEATIEKINFTTTGGKTGGLEAEVTVGATSYSVDDLASQARFTEIKVTLAGGEVVPPTPADTYTVAGSDAAIFGESWNPALAANDMTLADGVYTWTKAQLNLTAGTIEFKVVKNHSWDIAYPAQNYVVNIAEAGEYTLTITFDPATEAVAAEAVKKVIPQYEVAEAIAAGLTDNDEIFVRGIITKMEFKGKNFANYGSVNIYVSDATGAEGVFEFYNCYSLNADTFRTSTPAYDAQSTAWVEFEEVADENGNAIHVGDTVIAFGKYKLYSGTHELNTGCYLTEIKHPGDAPVEDEWAEIKFTEAAAADDIAEEATFAVEGSEFALTLHDAGNKMVIDGNDCRFGTAESYTMYNFRIKSGGASGSDKNYFTLNIPEAGTLRIAPRTGSNSATDRALIVIQGGDTLYNQIVQESQAIEVQEGENTVKVYPYVDVTVAAGEVVVRYTAGMNFYAFAFKADGEVPPTPQPTVNYYVAGSMNGWGPAEAYMLTPNNASLYEGEFTFAANDEFKVIGFDGENTTWYPDGMGNNFQITEAGDYKITFNPAGNVEGWYAGFFNVVKKEAPIVHQYEVAEAIAAGLQENDEVLVRGIITKMEFKGKNFAKYGSVNIYVADATGAEGEFEFFNCYSLNADTFRTSIPNYDPESTAWAQFNEVADANGNAIHVGDTVIAFGKYKLYNSTHELNTGCYLVDIKSAPVAPADTIKLDFNTENTTYAFVDNQYFSEYGSTDIYLSDINVNTSTHAFEGDGNYLVLDFYPENPNNVTGVYQALDETLDLEYTYMLTINGTDTAVVEFADGAIQVEIGEVSKEYGMAQLALAGQLISTEGDIYAITALVIAYYDFLPEEGVEDVVLDPKAIKSIVNGQVVIEKAGKTFNMNGQVIR